MQNQYVRSLFNAIAYRYDFLNHVLSGGVDVYWRRRAIRHLRDLKPRRVLDVATGTADFAIAALRLSPERVIGVDIAQEMLALGHKKLRQRGLDSVIALAAGEAEHLPFPDGGFDAAIVAFGARNFGDLEAGLQEMRRILRPGGKVIVLEFSRPASFPFRQMYLSYFKNIVPLVGRIVSKHDAAYRYLPDTVLRFPEGEDFLAILRRAGFTHPEQERLTFGIATVYSASR